MNQAQVRMLRQGAAQTIIRILVNDNDLEVGKGLAVKAGQQPLQLGDAVQGGNN
jgi:hypothetical protein